MNDTPLLRIQNLTKIFPPQKTIFSNVNLTLPSQAMIGIVGPDGSGKTTLLRLIAGLLLPTSGTIEVMGCDTVRDIEKIRAFSAYMPQRFGLYEDLTVYENLDLYASLRGLEHVKRLDTFEKLLHFTGLAPFTKRRAKDLSGGMKQKLGLACALIKKTQLLILDEPSVGVDPISRRELWAMVQSLSNEGISVLWSTTYLNEAQKCKEIVLLNEGQILYSGPPPPNLEDAFFDLLGKREEVESKWVQAVPELKKTGEGVVAKDLVKRFGSFTAVQHISFSVQRGEIFGFLGPNGAGKSTIFKMLCGLLTPSEGTAFVNGIDLQKAPSDARAKIGYMAQKFSLYGNLTVAQNLAFFAGIYSMQGSVEEKLKLFDLEAYQNTMCDSLPLGLKQRLALAVATAHWPEVLFLDEPTSGMDPVSRRQFWSQMRALAKKGSTLLVSTHFMDEAEYCDRIALIYRGLIIHLDTPSKLKEIARTPENQNPSLEDAFVKLIEEYDAAHP